MSSSKREDSLHVSSFDLIGVRPGYWRGHVIREATLDKSQQDRLLIRFGYTHIDTTTKTIRETAQIEYPESIHPENLNLVSICDNSFEMLKQGTGEIEETSYSNLKAIGASMWRKQMIVEVQDYVSSGEKLVTRISIIILEDILFSSGRKTLECPLSSYGINGMIARPPRIDGVHILILAKSAVVEVNPEKITIEAVCVLIGCYLLGIADECESFVESQEHLKERVLELLPKIQKKYGESSWCAWTASAMCRTIDASLTKSGTEKPTVTEDRSDRDEK